MHKALHPKDDVDRFYVSRKEGGLASVEVRVDTSIRQLENYMKRLITATRHYTNCTRINRTIITRKQIWEEKQLYRYFKRQTSEISYEKTWLRKGNLKKETESLLITAQNNAIRTNYMKVKIIKTQKIANVGYVVIETKRSII